MSTPGSKPLRLSNCPKCGYDLRGGAAEGACPECGAAYDRWMFYIPIGNAWSPLTNCVVFAFLAIIFGIISALVLAKRAYGAGTWLALIAMMFIGLLIASLVSLARDRRGRDSEMLVTATGIRWKRGLGQTLHLPWKHFAYVDVRRVRATLWVLTLRDRFWSIDPRSATVSVYLTGTKREVTKVRNELRRRIRRARETNAPRTAD